jgi:hypothetical protein
MKQTTEEKYLLLTEENKAIVIAQIELLIKAQLADQSRPGSNC